MGFVQYVRRIDFRFVPWSWPFAQDRRAEIDEYFRRECEVNPTLWNGRLLLLRDATISSECIFGSFFETDYASLLAGLAWDTMGGTVTACFPAAAVLASDDAFIVGEMAKYTRNAGQLLFPSGSVEGSDVVGDQVDFFGTLSRELTEETGLVTDLLEADSGWYSVKIGSRLPLIKTLRSNQPAETLKQRISQNLSAQSRPELCKIVIVRGLSDLSERMPLWVVAFLRHVWEQKV
jgi:hypothetical protein